MTFLLLQSCSGNEHTYYSIAVLGTFSSLFFILIVLPSWILESNIRTLWHYFLTVNLLKSVVTVAETAECETRLELLEGETPHEWVQMLFLCLNKCHSSKGASGNV